MSHLRRVLAFASLALAAACVAEPIEAAPEEGVASETAALAGGDPTRPEEGIELNGSFAPMCGDGPITYWDWVCHPLRGWQWQMVGQQNWNCVAPYFDPLQGREARCQVRSMSVCGGGDDEGQCYFESPGCPTAKPTTHCGLKPPPGGGTIGTLSP